MLLEEIKPYHTVSSISKTVYQSRAKHFLKYWVAVIREAASNQLPNVQTRALSLYPLDRMVGKDSERHD